MSQAMSENVSNGELGFSALLIDANKCRIVASSFDGRLLLAWHRQSSDCYLVGVDFVCYRNFLHSPVKLYFYAPGYGIFRSGVQFALAAKNLSPPNRNCFMDLPHKILIWQTEAAAASATDEFLWMRRDFHVNPKPLSCWLVWRYARPRNLATGQSPAAIVRRRSASWRETSSRQFQPSAAVLRTWPVPDTKTTFVDTKKHKRSTFSCFSCAVKTAFVSRASD